MKINNLILRSIFNVNIIVAIESEWKKILAQQINNIGVLTFHIRPVCERCYVNTVHSFFK